jgi:hypothetical protein
MKLYIAVCVRQKQRIYFRMDHDNKGQQIPQLGVLPRHQDVEPGRQEAIGGDLNEAQKNSIIKQLSVFGLQPAEEVNRLNGLTPYIYSVDRPVSKAQIDKAFNHNQGILAKDGRQRRERAAIAAGAAIESDEVKIAYEQITESELGGPQVAEGYQVDKAGDPGPARGGKGRRGRRGQNAQA